MAKSFKTVISIDDAASAASEAIRTKVAGDSQARLSIDVGGKLTWSSGAATGDTTLYRDSANTLKTDDAFAAASLDISGNADIDGTLEADAITVDGTALNEYIADTIGAMVGSNTETGISVTYDDSDNTLDFVVSTLNQDTTGNSATATALETARTIGGVSFNGTANIDLPGVNSSGNQDTSGTAALATSVTVSANNSTDETVYPLFVDGATGTQGAETDTGLTYNPSSGNLTIGGELVAASLDISGNVDVDGTLEADALTIDGTSLSETIADTVGAMVTSNTETGIAVTYDDSDNTLDFVVGTLNQNTTGNAATATALETARNIGGVSFDGTGNINLPGVNTSGSQDTSGNAATATALATARNIGGVSFDGTGNIDLPGVNSSGNQDTSGTAALATTVTVTANNSTDEAVYPVFVDGATGTQGAETDSALTYNPSSGNLSIGGELSAATLDISGNVDIDGSLETDGLSINGAITFPTADGSADQVLTTNGSGTLSWANQSGSGGGSVAGSNTQIQYNNSGSFGGSANFTFDGTSTVTLTSTDTGDSAAPIIELYRNSSSPADADYIGQLKFQAENDNDQKVVYAKITAKIGDATDTTEDGIIEVTHKKAGSNNISARWTSDALKLINGTGLEIADGLLTLGSTAVTSTAAELNLLDGITAGTVSASLAVIADANKDVSGFRNVTLTGELDAATLDISGDADIDGTLEADAITVDGTALNEYIADTVGGMVTSNTETGIAVTYEDADNTLDFVIGTLNQDTTGNAATATALATARNIGGVSFDGTGNINLPGVNTSGDQDTSGNAATATALATARNIGGVSFNGTANIDLPGVNSSGNQDTSGTAALATSVSVTANNSTDETVYPVFVDGATGTQGIETDTGLSYNPSSGVLTTTSVTGNLTGDVTGNLTGNWMSINTIQGSGDSFADNNTSVMTSAAIQDKILSYGYSTTSGDITSVTAGTNLTGGGTSGAVTLNLAASPELAANNYYKGSGSFGWYNTSQGTGMYSNDSTWVRTWDSGTGILSLGGMAAVMSGISSTSGYQYVMRNTVYTSFAYYTSMRASKEQITNFTNSGVIVDALNPVTFVESAPESETDAEKAWREADLQYGFVAEEICENDATSHLGQYDGEMNAVGWKWQDTISVLTAEVKSLRARVATLEGS